MRAKILTVGTDPSQGMEGWVFDGEGAGYAIEYNKKEVLVGGYNLSELQEIYNLSISDEHNFNSNNFNK
jgi:hypothetical protein